MRKLVAVAGLALAMAWAASAQAGEARVRPKQATGTFASAVLADDLVKWELDLGEDAGGKKTFEMSAEVKVTYAEKEGVKQGQSIRQAAGRDFKPREGMVTVKGKFVSAKLDGENVQVTITPAEGDKPLVVTLPKKLMAFYREAEGKMTALAIGVPRAPRKPKTE